MLFVSVVSVTALSASAFAITEYEPALVPAGIVKVVDSALVSPAPRPVIVRLPMSVSPASSEAFTDR